MEGNPNTLRKEKSIFNITIILNRIMCIIRDMFPRSLGAMEYRPSSLDFVSGGLWVLLFLSLLF